MEAGYLFQYNTHRESKRGCRKDDDDDDDEDDNDERIKIPIVGSNVQQN